MTHAHVGRFALAIAVLMSGLATDTSAAQDAAAPNTLSLERASRSRAKGQEGSPLFVYELADFQCPHCARFALEVFPSIDSAFVKTGKVHWVFVNLPVPGHLNAWRAHEAALCAGAIADKFWAMHDRLFAAQAEWSELDDPAPIFARMAKEAGVPAQPFAACVTGDRVASLLLQDVIFAASSRVNGTPAFIVNNEQTVMGLKTFEEWKDLLEKQLLRARGK
jgi:protein-disulfide isomerase